jgi:transcriptional regulator with XRE-family HTH domain
MGSRLRQARQRRFNTIREASRILGVNESTLKGYEIGTRAISRENIRMFSRELKVPMAWLEWGVGTMEGEEPLPQGRRYIPVVGHIGSRGQVDPDHGRSSQFGSVELPFPLPAEGDYAALRVVGDGMMPAYPPETVVIVTKEGEGLRQEQIGRFALVCLTDKRRFFRVIKRGSKRGLYNLQCWGAADIDDVRIEAVSEIVCVFPAHAVVPRPNNGGDDQVPKNPQKHLEWLKNYKDPKRIRRGAN